MQICGVPGHDSSIVEIKHNKVSYTKLERLLQIKHFGMRHAGYIDNHELYQKILNYTRADFFKEFSPYKSKVILQGARDHHLSHALSVELFEPCDVHVVIDGRGGDQWWSIWRNEIQVACGKIHDTFGSIGYIGAKEIKGDGLDIPGKLMGLQSYGKFRAEYYRSLEKWNLERLGDPMNSQFVSLLYMGKLPVETVRRLQSKARAIPHIFQDTKHTGQDRLDWLHTMHLRAGEIVMSIFDRWVSPDETIGYSGGVAQNVVWNTQIKQRYPKLRIYPHCGDEGISLGNLYHFTRQRGLLHGYPFCQDDEAPLSEPSRDTIQKVAQYLREGLVVAWYQGHGEVGPRALGNRSILMDPRITDGRDRINKVKNREYYRPFGSSILSEYAKEYFDLDFPNPYMLYLGHTQKNNLDAITHVDGTSRAQTVEPGSGNFRLLLEDFYELTGCPVLLNTSLNRAGKPIAGWISNAEDLFKESSGIDVLVVGDQIHTR